MLGGRCGPLPSRQLKQGLARVYRLLEARETKGIQRALKLANADRGRVAQASKSV